MSECGVLSAVQPRYHPDGRPRDRYPWFPGSKLGTLGGLGLRSKLTAIGSPSGIIANVTSTIGGWTLSLKLIYAILVGLVAFQTFHIVEHAMLYIQFYVQGISRPTAIIEALFNDTVPVVHFYFNLIVWIAFLGIFGLYYRAKRSRRTGLTTAAGTPHGHSRIVIFEVILWAGVIFQTVHMSDHILQLYQFSVLGITSPKGLFGQFIDDANIVIHLWLNGALLVGLIMGFVCFSRVKTCIRNLSPAARGSLNKAR